MLHHLKAVQAAPTKHSPPCSGKMMESFIAKWKLQSCLLHKSKNTTEMSLRAFQILKGTTIMKIFSFSSLLGQVTKQCIYEHTV